MELVAHHLLLLSDALVGTTHVLLLLLDAVTGEHLKLRVLLRAISLHHAKALLLQVLNLVEGLGLFDRLFAAALGRKLLWPAGGWLALCRGRFALGPIIEGSVHVIAHVVRVLLGEQGI